MSSRRKFFVASLGSPELFAVLPSCSTESPVDSCQEVVDRTWRHGKLAAGATATSPIFRAAQ